MLPFANCYPGPARAIQNAPSRHCAEQYDRFANKTYGEVLRMYQTSYSKQQNISEMLKVAPKSASHHCKQKACVTVDTSSKHDATDNDNVLSLKIEDSNMKETPKSASHNYKQEVSVTEDNSSKHDTADNDNALSLKSDNLKIKVPGSSKRTRFHNPWITDKLLEQIQHQQELYKKWVKVRKVICIEGGRYIKGDVLKGELRKGACSCSLCMEKQNRYNAYHKYRLFLKKVKREAQLSYYGCEPDELKQKRKESKNNQQSDQPFNEASARHNQQPDQPLCNDGDAVTVKSNTTDGLATVDVSNNVNSTSRQPVAMEIPSSGKDTNKAMNDFTSSIKWMGYIIAENEFNPAFQGDFGLQLSCGNYYMVGTNTPADPEEKGILVTNLAHGVNWHESLMLKVEKYGSVQKLHCRFMQMKHIALVEYEDHKSALKFYMALGKMWEKHPPCRKFWRKICSREFDPDNETGIAAVQAPPAQPQKIMNSKNQDTISNSKPGSSVPPSSSNREQPLDTHSPLNMLVPAIVPSLEEAGPVLPAQNTHYIAPKRKPMLKLNQKSPCTEPVTKVVEVTDSEDNSEPECTIIYEKAADEPVLMLIDDNVLYNKEIMSSSTNSAVPYPTSSSKPQQRSGKEIPVLVRSGENNLPVSGFNIPPPAGPGLPMVTPTGLTLVPHSFRILPPPELGMPYVITGSLVASSIFPTTLILRGIPSQLNLRSKLSPALTKFGNCKITLKYLGLRTTTCVEYKFYKDAVACFLGLYRLLALEYLQIFWMDTLPLPDPANSGAKDTDEVELEIAPGKNKMLAEDLKNRRNRLHTVSKAYFKKKVTSQNFRWNPKSSVVINDSLIKKNQTLLSNNIKSQKSILARLQSCENLETKERLKSLLKKLEDTHHVTAANLKALRSTAVMTEYSSDTKSTPSSSSELDNMNSIATNTQPKSIKVLNFTHQDVLLKHFSKFGKCSVLSYVADKTNVVCCQFERRKAALIAFVRGREMIWIEGGNEKSLKLELEWDFSKFTESMETSGSVPPYSKVISKASQISEPSFESTKESSGPEPYPASCELNDDYPTLDAHPKSIKILNFSDREVLQRHFNKFGRCNVFNYVCGKTNRVLCKFENRKEAVIAFSKGRTLNLVDRGNNKAFNRVNRVSCKKEIELELEWDFRAIGTSYSSKIVQHTTAESSQVTDLSTEATTPSSSKHYPEFISSSCKQNIEDNNDKTLQIFD